MRQSAMCRLAAGMLVVAWLLPVGVAHAQWRRERRWAYGEPHHGWRGRWFYDDRFHNGRYYPHVGFWVRALPPRRVVVIYGPDRFFFWEGVWYRPADAGYVVVTPPPGCMIPDLPSAYTTVWIGNTAYYYANGVYYAPASPGPGYVVIAPPPGADRATLEPPAGSSAPAAAPRAPAPPTAVPPNTPSGETTAARSPVVTPNKGQSQAQLFQDRADCARYATDQTGVDPEKATGTDTHTVSALKAYRHEEQACLEERDYTVR